MAEIIKLAPGVSEVMRQRLGKIETVLTAEGVAGIQGIVEIDRDFWVALQYIRSAQTEMMAGNVHLAVQKYWDAYNLAVEKHGLSVLSRQVVHDLVNSTIEVALKTREDYTKTMNKKADITADIRTLPYNELMELQRAVAAEIQRREPKTRSAESPRLSQADNAAAAKQTAYETTARETPDRAKELSRPVTAAPTPVELVRPAVAATSGSAELVWPTEQWKGSPEELGRKQHALIAFLRRVWKPFIEDNKVLVTREILKENDPQAAAALKGYLHRSKLPPDIRIFTSDQLTEHLSGRPISASSLPAPGA